MVKIRLSRVGAKGQPYYRIVVTDERNKRDGAALEVIGRYNPRTEPSTFEIDKKRLSYWRGVGAQLTEPVLVLLGEAKPKFHKPKNEVKPEPVAAEAPPTAVAAEGADQVKLDAPESTPEPSVELAKVETASETASPPATPEEVAQTIENTENIVKQETLEKQPSTQEEPVAEAEVAEEEASESEHADAPRPEGEPQK